MWACFPLDDNLLNSYVEMKLRSEIWMFVRLKSGRNCTVSIFIFKLYEVSSYSYTFNLKGDFDFPSFRPLNCLSVGVASGRGSYASKEINWGSVLEAGVEMFSPAAYPTQLLGLYYSTSQRQSVRTASSPNVAIEWVALLLPTQVLSSRSDDRLS
jgi:hypothetical protein